MDVDRTDAKYIIAMMLVGVVSTWNLHYNLGLPLWAAIYLSILFSATMFTLGYIAGRQ